MDSKLLFGICVSAVFLFVRYRWPVVPKPIATFGICLGVGLAVWSLTMIPIGLALSLILNAALVVSIGDYFFFGRRPAPQAVNAPREMRDEPPPYNPKRHGHSNALIEVHNARYDAKNALVDRRANLVPVISKMESALATVRKIFGLETPARTGDGRADLQLWLDYFDDVWPFVQSGHYDDANERAKQFIAARRT